MNDYPMANIDAAALPFSTVKFAVFTDFDGTLVDIAETPEDIDIPVSLAHQLQHAADQFDSAFAVITGRMIGDIDRFLSPAHFPVAGAHGIHRRRADGTMQPVNPDNIAASQRIAEALAPLLEAHPTLIMEDKDGTVALHYRQAPELELLCKKSIEEAARSVEGFTVLRGKMVFEARPHKVDKGEALRAFMQEEPFIGRTPIFIGDDVTDEDAFIAAQELGGIGIKLGEGASNAKLRIADVSSVHALLQGLGDMAARSRDNGHEGPAPSSNRAAVETPRVQ